MGSYLTRRILGLLPVLWAAATLVWFVMFFLPGDPARPPAGRRGPRPRSPRCLDPLLLARADADASVRLASEVAAGPGVRDGRGGHPDPRRQAAGVGSPRPAGRHPLASVGGRNRAA